MYNSYYSLNLFPSDCTVFIQTVPGLSPLKRPSHEIHNLQFFSQKSNQPHPMCRVPAPLIVWHGFYFSKIFVYFKKTANNLCNFAVEYMQLENKNHCGFFSKTMRGQGEVDPDREDFLRWSLGAKYSQQYFLNIF